jgi:hypothetical protein
MILLSLLLTGCAEYAVDGVSLAEKASAMDTGAMDSAADGGQPLPAWYAIRGVLEVGETGPESAVGTVQLEVVGEDLATVLCTADLDLAGLTAATTPDDPNLWMWWDLPVEVQKPPCATLPTHLSLGLGLLGPDSRARLGSVGLDGREGALYGAYAQADQADIVSFGYAGTAENLAGTTDAVEPPAPGTYQLAPLYLMALPGQAD